MSQKKMEDLSTEDLINSLENDSFSDDLYLESEEDCIPIPQDKNIEVFEECITRFIKVTGFKKGNNVIGLSLLYKIFNRYFFSAPSHKTLFIDYLKNTGYNITSSRTGIFLDKKHLKIPRMFFSIYAFKLQKNKTIKNFIKNHKLIPGNDPIDVKVLYALYFKKNYAKDSFIQYCRFRTILLKLFRTKRTSDVIYLTKSSIDFDGLDVNILKEQAHQIVENNYGKKKKLKKKCKIPSTV